MGIATRLSENGHEATIIVSGRFDFSQHGNFKSAFEKTPSAVESFIVDLKEAEYIDNSALVMLLVLRDQVGNQREKIRIVNANPEIRKALKITYFDRIFAVS